MDVRFFPPSERLAPFVRSLTVIETRAEATRTLLPEPGLILGLRWGGSATLVQDSAPLRMPNHTLAGLRSTARRMRTSAGAGAVFAHFHEAGAAQLFAEPLHELFGGTLALDAVMPRSELERASARLAEARCDAERLAILEQFLLGRLQPRSPDALVAAAVRAIRAARGTLRIAGLARTLGIGQDALEKRFRRAVGAAPKQLASILRLRHAVRSHRPGASLSALALEAGYFDQSHFIREFRAVTGEPPQRFFRAGEHC